MFTVFWNLAALAAGTDTFQQVSSGNILPPKAYRDAFKTPVSSTSDTPLDNASFVGAPQNEENGGVDLQGVNLNMYAATDVDVGSQSTITEDSVSSLSSSVTAQAVVDGMDLQQCVQQIHFANDQYTSFNNALSGTSMEVKQASLKLSQIDIVIHNILSDEDNFKSEIARLDELYNTLAVRGNALGKWMSDEKGVRDNLEELYRNMVAKNTDEESRLALLRTNMKSAMTRLTQVQEQTAVVLSSVADAQVAMYDWAANVTLAVNTHTTKLNSLLQSLQYRIAQIDDVVPEMRNMAQRTISISHSLGETNLAYAAANVLSHVESVLATSIPADATMDIPSHAQGG